MNIRNIPIDEATPDQIRAFATGFLNLELASDATDDAVLSAVLRAQPGSTLIFVKDEDEQQPEEAAAPPPEAFGNGMAGTLGQCDPRAVIEIPIVESDDKTGEMDVMVGVNGRAWQLKRGVPLDVPWRVVEALKLTIATSVRHDMDTGEEQFSPTKRFPFHFHSQPTQEQIDEWHRLTDSEFCA